MMILISFPKRMYMRSWNLVVTRYATNLMLRLTYLDVNIKELPYYGICMK